MPGLDWLTAQPVAHRGLHDAANGLIENTRSAFAAAVAGNFAIECDLQISSDGEVMVHHDHVLGRLTEGKAALHDMKAADLKRVRFKSTADPMLTLGELCDLVAGRVTLVIEIKSRFDGDMRPLQRTADVLLSYQGPVAAMSFDPAQVEALGAIAPGLPRGIVAMALYDDPEWDRLSPSRKWQLAHLTHFFRTRPHFVAYHVKGLPAVAPLFARHVMGLPLLTWTVRTEADRATAGRWADQMIFEGFRP